MASGGLVEAGLCPVFEWGLGTRAVWGFEGHRDLCGRPEAADNSKPRTAHPACRS